MSAGRLRLVALWIALIGLVAASRPTPAAWLLGAPLIVAGEAVRWWAAGHLRKTVELITSGPYAHTRNPLYLGRWAIASGLCLLCPLPLHGHHVALVLAQLLFFGYYLPRKERVEPARLLDRHGDRYARYREAVPALWPRLAPYRDAGADRWRAERMLRNREHWMLIGLTLLLALQAWRAWG